MSIWYKLILKAFSTASPYYTSCTNKLMWYVILDCCSSNQIEWQRQRQWHYRRICVCSVYCARIEAEIIWRNNWCFSFFFGLVNSSEFLASNGQIGILWLLCNFFFMFVILGNWVDLIDSVCVCIMDTCVYVVSKINLLSSFPYFQKVQILWEHSGSVYTVVTNYKWPRNDFVVQFR